MRAQISTPMSQREKEFAKWATTKSNVESETVEAVLRHYFGARLKERSGGSHNLLISLPELVELPDFQFGHLMIPLKGGQGVKPRYLRLAVKAFAELIRIQDEAEAARAKAADEEDSDTEATD